MSPTSKEMQTRNAINKKHSVVERSQWGLKIPKVSQLVSDWDFDSIVLHHSGNLIMDKLNRMRNKHGLNKP